MKSILVELSCPTCMYHTYRKSETLILSDFETQAREELLQDTFFTLRCPRCGRLIVYLHPLAYVDKRYKFILLIKAEKDFQEKDHHLYHEERESRKRFLCDHTQIAEKIRIFEDELDDRAIEILKLRLKQYYTRREQTFISLSYHDVDNVSQTIWFDLVLPSGIEPVAVMKEEYERVRKQLCEEPSNQYLRIDEAWALAWMKKQ